MNRTRDIKERKYHNFHSVYESIPAIAGTENSYVQVTYDIAHDEVGSHPGCKLSDIRNVIGQNEDSITVGLYKGRRDNNGMILLNEYELKQQIIAALYRHEQALQAEKKLQADRQEESRRQEIQKKKEQEKRHCQVHPELTNRGLAAATVLIVEEVPALKTLAEKSPHQFAREVIQHMPMKLDQKDLQQLQKLAEAKPKVKENSKSRSDKQHDRSGGRTLERKKY